MSCCARSGRYGLQAEVADRAGADPTVSRRRGSDVVGHGGRVLRTLPGFQKHSVRLGAQLRRRDPSSLTGWTRMPEVEPAGTVTASGRRLSKPRLAAGEMWARPVSRLWKRGGPS